MRRSPAPFLVEQARHIVVLHEGAGGGQALGGELLGGDAGAQHLLDCAHGGDNAALLGGERLDTLRVGCRLGLEQRRVEVHQAVVARDQRDVAVLLEHLRIQQLGPAVDGVLKTLAVGLGDVASERDAHRAPVLKDEQHVGLVILRVDDPDHALVGIHLEVRRQVRTQLRGLGVLKRRDLAFVHLALVGEDQQLVRVGGRKLDEGLIAVFVFELRSLAQNAVRHLLEVALA